MPRSSEQRGRRGLCRAPILCLTCGVLWGLLCCLTGLPAARGAAAVGERHAGPDAALAEMTAAARLLAVLAPARSRPDDSEAQRAFIAAFPTDQAAFAAGMRLTGDAPLDWLLGLAQADNRALRQAARQRLRAVDPVRHIRAADSIYAAVNAWPCRDFLELARSPDPVVSAGALLLARNMAWPEKGRAALDSLRPGDGPDIRLLKLAAVVAWNGEAAVPDAAWEFVRAFPDDPRDLARLLTLENSLCRSEDSLTLSLLRDLARDGTPDLKMAADAKWRGARTLRRASLPPSAPVSGRKLARALLPFFADPDPGVSATAMLYAARLEAPGPLRAWLLKHADPEDTPLRKALAAYCLARWSPLDQERQQAFLRQMFINWETFWQVILFEDFTALAARSPSLDWVCRLSLGRESEVRREARDNLLAVHLALAKERKEGRLDAHKNQVDRLIFAAIAQWAE